MVVQPTRLQAFAAAVALAAAGSSSMLVSALELTVADCAGLAALTSDAMTEDVNLFLDEADEFMCDTVRTTCMVVVSGQVVCVVAGALMWWGIRSANCCTRCARLNRI